ncbi:MAG: helix-turn-helix transcriptional regulator [Muribaculaceae bacterium]|jgi:iron-sulfur cluster repair protein YtfE (RIC family)|nr:helix-turn-helix transcriptional regulator [Muribaculaceae bacterium]
MALFNPDSKLSDIVLSDVSVITVLNRFDIFLGVGDKTVNEICREKRLDVNFLLAIINTNVSDEYFPETALKSFKASEIIEYLKKTNNYYLQFQIPNIERHFNSFINHSINDNNNLELMRNFFLEVKRQLIDRINDDNSRWFPEILRLESSLKSSKLSLNEVEISFDDDGSDSIEDKLSDLISMLVRHLSGDYDLNLCLAVIVALVNIEKDIRQNNRIRNRILKPLTNALVAVNSLK